MLTVSRVVDASLLVSVFWGMIAIGSLLAALVLRDKALGQSSLLIFALSGMKVLVYDLAGSPAPVRIGTLGGSLAFRSTWAGGCTRSSPSAKSLTRKWRSPVPAAVNYAAIARAGACPIESGWQPDVRTSAKIRLHHHWRWLGGLCTRQSAFRQCRCFRAAHRSRRPGLESVDPRSGWILQDHAQSATGLVLQDRIRSWTQ